MTVYIDLVMLLNFLTDLLLLLCTGRLSGRRTSFLRLSAGALTGALYSGACLLPSFFFLGNPLWYLIFLILISLISFGCSLSALRSGALFLLLSMALGGMAMAVQRSQFPVLLLEALALWLLTRICFGDRTLHTEYVPVTVNLPQGPVQFTALVDTGNQLRDPVTGEAVTVVSPRQAELLTGLSKAQLADPMATMLHPPLRGLRLIPYCALNQGSGMLLGLKFPSVTIGSHTGPALLAFASEGFSGSRSFEALTGGGSLC